MFAPQFAYVGSFTTQKRKARGDGLHVWRFDATTGDLAPVQHVGGLTNPSWLTLGCDGRLLYAAHGDCDFASAFRLDVRTGEATLLNQAASGGSNGVRLALDVSGRFAVVANYASGNVALLAIEPDGRLADCRRVVALSGEPGPDPIEQTSSHPHDIVFDPSGKFVLVPDKGLDCVFALAFDGKAGTLALCPEPALRSRPGAGPRHLAWHPSAPIVWVLNELDATITTCRWEEDRGVLTPLQVVSTLPDNAAGGSTAAEIAVSLDGRFVYCSNRGDNTIAIFRASAGGGLTAVAWEASQGRTPRFIGLDATGRFLLAANEQSDAIVVFSTDAQAGLLVPTGRVANASPSCIVFARAG